ncbi:hypothetical protein BCR42DRAFT_13810 [Absidia repens]|uniref:Uncharacterized protein n=1 Tax=Absidia repens TaxID=90262 RepID=A0A1X2J1N8_9FUNG|nr:hypothetical protein BCR42DRAFT_13810 [Absidia repens]
MGLKRECLMTLRRNSARLGSITMGNGLVLPISLVDFSKWLVGKLVSCFVPTTNYEILTILFLFFYFRVLVIERQWYL